jgi:hypothetical protein
LFEFEDDVSPLFKVAGVCAASDLADDNFFFDDDEDEPLDPFPFKGFIVVVRVFIFERASA